MSWMASLNQHSATKQVFSSLPNAFMLEPICLEVDEQLSSLSKLKRKLGSGYKHFL